MKFQNHFSASKPLKSCRNHLPTWPKVPDPSDSDEWKLEGSERQMVLTSPEIKENYVMIVWGNELKKKPRKKGPISVTPRSPGEAAKRGGSWRAFQQRVVEKRVASF